MSDVVAESPLLLSIPDVAELIGSSTAHVWRMISAGKFGPAVLHLGRLARVRRDELEGWIQAGCPARVRWTWKGGTR